MKFNKLVYLFNHATSSGNFQSFRYSSMSHEVLRCFIGVEKYNVGWDHNDQIKQYPEIPTIGNLKIYRGEFKPLRIIIQPK